MEVRNEDEGYMEEVGTPAIYSSQNDREEETLGLTGRRNEDIGLNSQQRPRSDVFTMHRRGSFLSLGTWNVRTLNQAGKLENAIKEMEEHKLDLLGIAEMRWKESGSTTKNGYTVMYSGGEEHKEGVGMIISKKYAANVMGFLPVSSRVMLVKLAGKPFNIAIVQAYAPTGDHTDEDIEKFYQDIEKACREVKSTDVLIVMGDMNAKIGNGKVDGYIGGFGLGNRNERGDRMLEFCVDKDLMVANTYFQHPVRRLYTWKSPGDVRRNQIDYIMVKRRFRNCIKDCRTYPGADINSDHCLLVSKMNIKLKRIVKKKGKDQYDLEMFKQENIQQRYAVEVFNRFSLLSSEDGEQNDESAEEKIEKKWSHFKEGIHEATKKFVNKKEKKKHKEWMTQEILNLMTKRKEIKEKNGSSDVEYNKMDRRIKKECIKAKEEWFNEKCDELLKLERDNNSKEMHRKVKEVTGIKKKSSSGTQCIKDKLGNLLFEKESIDDRWMEYIQELYDDQQRIADIVVNDLNGPAITKSEILHALRRMKNRKAPGIDEITTEHLKALDDNGIKILTEICNDIYHTGYLPEELKHSIFVKLPKKPNANQCTDYRTLCLMGNVTKIILRVLMVRNSRIFDREAGRTQSGFRKGMGTREGIFNLRNIVEKLLEKHRKIYICFIDYEKAFDRVYHEKLIEILEKYEIDGKDIRLIKNLYWYQTASVKTDEGLTASFPIKRGVRQGCVLSPPLFNVYTEQIFRNVEDMPGVKIAGEYINNLRYADDTVLIAESEEELQKLVNEVKERSLEYGLKMNTKKTKTMVIRRNVDEPCRVDILVDGVTLEQVDKYTYLGQVITEDGRCEVEIRRRIQIAKTNFLKMKNILTSRKLSIELRMKIMDCYILSSLLYASETWTINEADWKRLEAFETWTLRRMLKISYLEHRTNEDVFKLAKSGRKFKIDILTRKIKYFGHLVRRNGLQRSILENYIPGSRGRGRPRHTWFTNIRQCMGKTYSEMAHLAGDRDKFRAAVAEMRSDTLYPQ